MLDLKNVSSDAVIISINGNHSKRVQSKNETRWDDVDANEMNIILPDHPKPRPCHETSPNEHRSQGNIINYTHGSSSLSLVLLLITTIVMTSSVLITPSNGQGVANRVLGSTLKSLRSLSSRKLAASSEQQQQQAIKLSLPVPPTSSQSSSSSQSTTASLLSPPISHLAYPSQSTGTSATGASSMPNIFHLPYEKLANPLSTFLSWISSQYKSDRKIQTYDLLYRRPPSFVDENLMTGEEDTLTLPDAGEVDTKDVSSSQQQKGHAERRFDLMSSFSIPKIKLSRFGKGFAGAYTQNKGYSTQILPKTPQYDIMFPRHLSPEKRVISPITQRLINKYAPNPKIHFYPQYYPQHYSVPVPFMTNDKMIFTTNSAYGTQMGSSYPATSITTYRHVHKPAVYSSTTGGISSNSAPTNIGYSTSGGYIRGNVDTQLGKSYAQMNGYTHKSPSSSSTGNTIRSSMIPSARGVGGGSVSVSKSVPGDTIDGWNPGSGSGRPYTGKAQYSTIDNSATDPMSPSATRYNAFHTIASSRGTMPSISSTSSKSFSPSKSLIKISELSNKIFTSTSKYQ
ncbi:uncharacterized protein LOC141855050 isoform X2 [Brevipalpus obovatus]|uniref:uncharacterized protein LOC141855050 isoform X2 n=1 Tax=Brevipalpus obovatus TaxID=246614 RepID=UPI003D9E6F12